MSPSKKPPRSWRIDDLFDLGEKEGVRYLKTIPILILERWVQGGREPGVANYVWTKELASRLVNSGFVPPFKPKGTSNILGALGAIQNSRNLTRPYLTEYQGDGLCMVNLPQYEQLLQEYRNKYKELYPDEYHKLFPNNEPDWDLLKTEVGLNSAQLILAETRDRDEIGNLLASLERYLRDREDAYAKLMGKNQNLQSEIDGLNSVLQENYEVAHRKIVDDELRNDCSEFLKKEDTYVDSIRRAGVVLEERLRKAVGANGPAKFKQGVDLVDYALRKDTGQLILSEHPAEQEGVHMLFRGAVQFVRNPPSHKKLLYTEDEAEQAIGLIDYLLLLLRQSKPRNS